MLIYKDFKFDAAHMIQDHFGKCKNLHGHTYNLRVYLKSENVNDETGVVLDYYNVKEIINPLIERLDHSFICNINDPVQNEFKRLLLDNKMKVVLMQTQTTAENIAIHIYKYLKSFEFLKDFKIKILINETPNTGAEYGDSL